MQSLSAAQSMAAAVPRVSFEFFPPRTPAMEAQLWRAIKRLAPLRPRFVSVTYGAGGSTRGRTHATVTRLRQETALQPAAHLTCVGASHAELVHIAQRYWESGVRHIVALRGDAPEGGKFIPHPQGCANAAELVALLRQQHPFEVSVAAHPETHPEAISPEADLYNLQRKLEAGANRAITQYFFDTDLFLRFRDRAVRAGITAKLVPGILPVTNFAQTVKFSERCGASVPNWLRNLFDGLDEEPDTRQLVAASTAAEQCRRLQAEGVNEFHFYTLNRAELTLAICRLLGINPAQTTDPNAVPITANQHA